MMRHGLIPAVLLAACAGTPGAGSQYVHPLAWMSGCWQTPDGDYREVWSDPDHGYLFGYALSLDNDTVTFFEQTRIEPSSTYVFNAYPAGKGPSPFPEIERGPTSIVFANADHDFPQRIRYAREGEQMAAEISLMDGSNAQTFEFAPCTD